MGGEASGDPAPPVARFLLVNSDALLGEMRASGVEAWFRAEDAAVLCALNDYQQSLGVTGDLLEIGCYHGASAILLGTFTAGDEQLVVCDLFGEAPSSDQHFSSDASFRSTFETNYLRFHDALPTIIAEPSTSLSSSELGRRFRMIHIDGAHDYASVRNDLLLAKELLIPGGIVIFDDIISLHTPGVSGAVWEGVVNDGLLPLFQTRKLYATWDPDVAPPVPAGFSAGFHEVLGHPMYHLIRDEPPRSRRYQVATSFDRAARRLAKRIT